MLVKVQDTKKPNREPFETSEAGLRDLQRIHGNRYKPVSKVIVTQEAITVTPKGDFVPPAKTNRGK